MTYYTLKISASMPFYKSTLYTVERDRPIQTYTDFCAIKSLCEYPPDLWEIVKLPLDGRLYALLVDESGYCHDERLPVNSIATSLYSVGTLPIVGDVFVFVPREADLYFMTKEELEPWVDLFEHGLCPNLDVAMIWKNAKLD